MSVLIWWVFGDPVSEAVGNSRRDVKCRFCDFRLHTDKKRKNIKTCRKSRAPIKNKIKIEKEGAQVEEKRQKMFSTVVPIYLKFGRAT